MTARNRNNPKRQKSSESSYSLMEFLADFPDDETCLRWLWRTRFAIDEDDNAQCMKCQCVQPFKRYTTAQKRQSWTCTACGTHVHPTAGTIFHKSSTPLHLWFYAMYLMTSTRCGISAKQLERELGVTYKTAWRMFTLIRNVLMVEDATPLTGTVEVDEMYVGGKPRMSDKAGFRRAVETGESVSIKQASRDWTDRKKTPVFGMVERSRVDESGVERPGRVIAKVVPSVQAVTLKSEMIRHIDVRSTINSDDAAQYRKLKREGWTHNVINHSQKVYVSGDVHTQMIDGFWSLVKRGISGTHFHVSAKWLQGYLNEYAWRYNRRGVDGEGNRRLMFLEMALNAAMTD